MRVRWPALVAIVVVIIAACVPLLDGLGAKKPLLPIDVPAPGNTPVVEVNLISFDPAVGDVSGRLHLRLPKQLIGKDESPTKDLVFVDADTVDESILNIPASKPYSYYDSFINSRYQVNDPGSQFMYPFDEHETYLHFSVAEQRGKTLTPIPISYDCSNCDVDGFNVTVKDNGSTASDVRLKVELRRTHPIIIFAAFITVAMWAMTVVITVLAVRVARKKKKAPEVATMGFIAGLLFAFPAIRGAMPRVPPIGVITDYAGFFWCEVLLMFTLVLVMIAWLRFPEPAEEEEAK